MSRVTDTSTLPHVPGARLTGEDLSERPEIARLASLLPVAELSSEEIPRVAASQAVLDKTARVLFRSKRSNVLLCGAKGVGKTATIHAFADHCNRGRFPFLKETRLLYMDVANVGPEDSRACLESIFAAVSDAPSLILCLDGITTLIRRANGGTNKPLLLSMLKRSGVRVIGTMTDCEYVDHVGNDVQMLEVFSRVDLKEPAGEELTRIVRHATRGLEREFEIEISDEVSDRTVALTSTFLLNESHPAKSIDVLRHVCEDFTYENTQTEGNGRRKSQLQCRDVVEVLSRRTGIPQETISGQGRGCDFVAAISDAVVGQTDAVREVATELELISAGLTEPSKPASVMMFTGMTGVGKTELAKRIAELYSTSRRLQVYSMGNFTESHSVSGIIGVPPGYVGHEEGGRLVNELRADPYSVILLDEAEKCHPNIWKPFLNLFDEGWIVDQRGVKAYADRAMFILTTNAGDRNISQLTRSGKSPEEIIQAVKKSLSRVRSERSSQPVFPPQFLSRMKRIIVFEPLDEQAMIGIAKCAANRLVRRWQQTREKTLVFNSQLIERIGTLGHRKNELANGQEGGRIVHKLMSDHVEHVIFTRSLENRAGYDQCREIRVSLSEGLPGDDIQVEVQFL